MDTENWLYKQSQIKEEPFSSSIPLVAKIRTQWNNIAARWYIQKLFVQQNKFNATIAHQLYSQNERLIAQDKDIVRLTKTVAELELHIKQLSRHE